MRLHSLIRGGVFAVDLDASLADAAVLMRREDIGSLVVYDRAGTLAGIITERDLVRCLAETVDPEVVRVARFMTSDPIVANPDDGIEEVAARMLTMGVRHLPVVQEGRVLGMVSVRDLLESTLPGT